MTPTPFELHVPDDVLRDLRERLARTRFPDEPPGEPWATGTSLGYMRDLVAYWRDRFDWRAEEAALNRFRQLKVPIDGIELHFIHAEGKGPRPMPLLLSHGWPGSVLEFTRLIPLLTDPGAHGGDPADAFTVVAPSLPGYTLSFTPGQKRFGIPEIADTFARLMTDVLGYRRFAAQGGDWGAAITTRMAYVHADKVAGIHLNLLANRPDAAALSDAVPEHKRYKAELEHFLKEETGYQWIQGTKPTTLAFGLTDSPAGLAAWIAEKFRTWTDNDGAIESVVGRDALLANITLYWVTGAIGSSFWPYYARMHSPWIVPDGEKVMVPTGYIEFPKEIRRPPRSVAERMYGDIRRWTVAEKGGHFAAMEQPELLAREVREMFRGSRG